MSTIKCPECQKKISDINTSCPNCGCPITSSANTLEQGTITQAEIYKTAFIHSVMIVLEAFILPIWTILLYNNGSILAFANLYGETNSYMHSYMLGFLFSVLIFIEIFWITHCRKTKSNLRLADKCRTIFLMWSSYAIIYCICYGWFAKEHYIWSGRGYLFSTIIDIAIIIVLIIVGILLFAKGTDFKKYSIITIIWGICALLVVVSIISPYDVFFISAILTIPVSIIMGILWGVNSSKTKTIQ